MQKKKPLFQITQTQEIKLNILLERIIKVKDDNIIKGYTSINLLYI